MHRDSKMTSVDVSTIYQMDPGLARRIGTATDYGYWVGEADTLVSRVEVYDVTPDLGYVYVRPVFPVWMPRAAKLRRLRRIGEYVNAQRPAGVTVIVALNPPKDAPPK